MRYAVLAIALSLAGCRGTSFRSPVERAPALQSPIVTEAQPTEPCRPVYAPVAPHIDDDSVICENGVCRLRDPLPKSKPAPAPAPARFSEWEGLALAVLLLAGYLVLRRSK